MSVTISLPIFVVCVVLVLAAVIILGVGWLSERKHRLESARFLLLESNRLEHEREIDSILLGALINAYPRFVEEFGKAGRSQVAISDLLLSAHPELLQERFRNVRFRLRKCLAGPVRNDAELRDLEAQRAELLRELDRVLS